LNPDISHTVPLTISSRIQQAYEEIRVLDINVNPVKRVHLNIDRVQDQLCITEVEALRNDAGELLAGNNGTNSQQEQTNPILLQMKQIKNQMAAQYDSLGQSINNLRADMSDKHAVIQKNITRIFIQPPRQATRQQQRERAENDNLVEAGEAFDEGRTQIIAELSTTPRSLYDLWIEYTNGIGGRKPAKDFSYTERGKYKFKYCRRKVVWDCIVKHVNAGYLAAVAIDRIYQAYGINQTVSSIITAMVKDKKRGGHPNLRF
jgi:hypothetical protein